VSKIAGKILEVMKSLALSQDLDNLNDILIEQKLITRTEYKITESRESITIQGVVWHYVIVLCELTIIDAESGESLMYAAHGAGLDKNDKAMISAQKVARMFTWMTVLNVTAESKPVEPESELEPEIIVETPESKLIAIISALWKPGWGDIEPYFIKRRGKGLSEMSIPELTVEMNELQGYIRGNG